MTNLSPESKCCEKCRDKLGGNPAIGYTPLCSFKGNCPCHTENQEKVFTPDPLLEHARQKLIDSIEIHKDDVEIKAQPQEENLHGWEKEFDEKFSKSIAEMFDYGAETRDFHRRTKSFITNLLTSREESLKKKIEGMKREEGHETLFSHRNGHCKCTYNTALDEVLAIINQEK